ncbi:MAG TPA: hypothetical protein EYQ80_07180, partial [Candidatus Poseidoniales archaeon]|nr:hypothetical protein [Candidatus Poseidoniales archaeon]
MGIWLTSSLSVSSTSSTSTSTIAGSDFLPILTSTPSLESISEMSGMPPLPSISPRSPKSVCRLILTSPDLILSESMPRFSNWDWICSIMRMRSASSTSMPILRNISTICFRIWSSHSSLSIRPTSLCNHQLYSASIQSYMKDCAASGSRRKCRSRHHMVQQDQDRVLDETERVAGRTALRNNVEAAVALAGAVRSTLGPKGLDKMLLGEDGSALVTNDGVTVLEAAKVEHPTARMLISTSRAQDDEVHDGTSSTVVLTAELLVNALELIDRGVHPAVVAQGYRMCGPVLNEALEEMS